MPKKGSRSINVDGKLFRWRVNGEDYEPSVRIERALTGAAIQALFPPKDSITPASVRALIEEAVGQGWDPEGSREDRIDHSSPYLHSAVVAARPTPIEPPVCFDGYCFLVGQELRVSLGCDHPQLGVLRSELLRQFPPDTRRGRRTKEVGRKYELAWDGMQAKGFHLWVSRGEFNDQSFLLATLMSSFELAKSTWEEFLHGALQLGISLQLVSRQATGSSLA